MIHYSFVDFWTSKVRFLLTGCSTFRHTSSRWVEFMQLDVPLDLAGVDMLIWRTVFYWIAVPIDGSLRLIGFGFVFWLTHSLRCEIWLCGSIQNIGLYWPAWLDETIGMLIFNATLIPFWVATKSRLIDLSRHACDRRFAWMGWVESAFLAHSFYLGF